MDAFQTQTEVPETDGPRGVEWVVAQEAGVAGILMVKTALAVVAEAPGLTIIAG